MKRFLLVMSLVVLGLLWPPARCPAPLVYRPGEGWTYESASEGKWTRARAKDQFEVAQEAFDNGKIGLAIKAARRTVKRWPLSDYAPKAQALLGRCYEKKKYDEKAFKEYQRTIERYPKVEGLPEILQRQYDIATRFLNGQWFKLWGVIPFFPSMEKTAQMYAKIVRNGPFSEVGPKAQMGVAAAREKQKDYVLAVRAYETAADRYYQDKAVASEALFRAGQAWKKQAQTAEYDQSAAGSAIATFSDFIVLYPEDERVREATTIISDLRTEQSRGAFQVARFYEKKRRWKSAEIYYNETIVKDPESTWAAEARLRLEFLRRRVAQAADPGTVEPSVPAPLPAVDPTQPPPERP
jgi:outer membrane protein assembly factor BamD